MTTISNETALKRLEAMTDQEFSEFAKKLPPRVLLTLNLLNWRDILPQWYIKTLTQ